MITLNLSTSEAELVLEALRDKMDAKGVALDDYNRIKTPDMVTFTGYDLGIPQLQSLIDVLGAKLDYEE